MPNPGEGLIFGDFTPEEWEKYFNNSLAPSGNFQAVEFLFDFENSDPDDQFASYKAEPRTQSLSSDTPGAKNIHAGPEDSGVEVGQESEQESAPGMVVQSMSNASNLLDKQKMLGQMNRTNVGHTEFGEKSISEEHDIEKRTARPSRPTAAVSPGWGFPSLAATVTDKAGEKTDTERSRKRRRRRRQRKRSGSVSSSSSECSEKERTVLNSPVLVPKHKSSSVLSSEEFIVEKESLKMEITCSSFCSQQGDFLDKENSSPRQSPNCCDEKNGETCLSTDGTLNSSPVQSDTDASMTGSLPEKRLSYEHQEDESLQTLEDQCKMLPNTLNHIVEKKETPKLSSWADLFKVNSSSSPGIIVKALSTVVATKTCVDVKKKEARVAQTIIGVEEDKYAKQFAEAIQKQQFKYSHEAFIPCGLINKGNWCYINATLQALAVCSPFFNLLRQLPFIKDKGPTSTPILDSMVTFVNEFKVMPVKQGNSANKPKTDFCVSDPVEPSYVYKMLSTIQSSLSAKGRQEDAQEFLNCILNGMHEEMLQLSNVISTPLTENEIAEVLTDIENIHASGQEDDGDWEEVGPKNKSVVTRVGTSRQSPISDIFGGFLRSSVHLVGLKDSANVEPFFELHLDVQPVTSVEEALKNLVLKEEVQGYTCSTTKVQVDISRRVTLEGLPKILILHLKRFIYSKSGSQKLQKVIDYPLELIIGKELLSSSVKHKYSAAQKTYNLFAVVYHHGKNSCGGHYTCDVCHPFYGWIRADDTRLKTVPSSYVLKPTQGKDPYMLFYRRTDLNP